MPILNPPNSPPQTETGAVLYKLGREWCLGDTLKVFNNNFTNLDTRADLLSTNLYFNLSSHVYKFNTANSSTIDLFYNTSLNQLSGTVVDGSIGISKLGGTVTQAAKALLTAVKLSALGDIQLNNVQTNQILIWNGTLNAWVNGNQTVGGGGGGGGGGGNTDPTQPILGYAFAYPGDINNKPVVRGDISVAFPENVTEFNDNTYRQTWTIRDFAVNNNKIANLTIQPGKLAPGAPNWIETSTGSGVGNVAIGTSPLAGLSTPRLTVAGNISASGTIFGNFNEMALATRSGNLTGGSLGQIPYQTGVGFTGFTTVGESGQFLQSRGGTAAPIWATPTSLTVQAATSAVHADRLRTYDALEDSAFQNRVLRNRLVFQRANNVTRFLETGSNGQFLTIIPEVGFESTYGIPAWTSINLNAINNLGINIVGITNAAAHGRIPYQTALSATSYSSQPTSSGQLLQSGGSGTAPYTPGEPSWISPSSLVVGRASELTVSSADKPGVLYIAGDNNVENTKPTSPAQVLASNGSVGNVGLNWVNINSLQVSSAGTCTGNSATASNLNKTTTGLVYQSGSSTTEVKSFGDVGDIVVVASPDSGTTKLPGFLKPADIVPTYATGANHLRNGAANK